MKPVTLTSRSFLGMDYLYAIASITHDGGDQVALLSNQYQGCQVYDRLK
jgi:hypothetical protein